MRVLTILIFIVSATASAQDYHFDANRQSEKRVLMAAPAYHTGDLGARFELNLGDGSIALEAVRVAEAEEYSESEVKENGVSLVTEGYEGALYVSRFSQPTKMGGFYWSLALGYRYLTAQWRVPAAAKYDIAADQDSILHEMTVSGFTGHARLGYRYIPDAMPLFLGVSAGLRHFESKFEDSDETNNSPTSDKERASLARFMMTRPEFGVEAGFVF